MLIQGALANLGSEVSTDEFLKYLTTELPSISFFKLQRPSGSIMAAAFDWRGVLYDAAAIVTLGTVLWNAYTFFIKPLVEKNPESSSGIYIQIKNQDGQSFQFMLGKDYKDKEIFINEFNTKIKRMSQNQSTNQTITEIEEIRHTGYWVQVK